MSETKGEKTLANHPPAVKVGGRRLSISSKPKMVTKEEVPHVNDTSTPIDYPRPTGPSNTNAQNSNAHREEARQEHEEDKERKHGYNNLEKDRKRSETGHFKFDVNRPTRDFMAHRGIHGRIDQPISRVLKV